MKTTGIIRNVDDLGRLVLPKEMRRVLGIENGTAVQIFNEGDAIVVRRYNPTCIFCGNAEDLTEYKGKKLCAACIAEISK